MGKHESKDKSGARKSEKPEKAELPQAGAQLATSINIGIGDKDRAAIAKGL